VSVTAAAGFVASGVHCGIKADGAADLALVATLDGSAVPAAAVFTANLGAAAPVQACRAHLLVAGSRAAAVVLNSGNANAATGATGREHAEEMCRHVGRHLEVETDHVLVCSTGLIGIPLPIEAVLSGIPGLVATRAQGPDAGDEAARAILTTDTFAKQIVVRGSGFTVGGMAKGAAMLSPAMATMLAVLTTDADVGSDLLGSALRAGVEASFNELSIDGACSTNDTVVVLASAKAGRPSPGELTDALAEACAGLAAQMVEDAEGATKVVTVVVRGAGCREDAARAARRIADSQLVKCSWFGGDPYWGRIFSELGSAKVAFDPDRVLISYGGTMVCRGGVAVAHDAAVVAAHMSQRHIEVIADLGLGDGTATMLTNDLSPAYIAENERTS